MPMQVRLGPDGFFNRSAPSQAPPQVQAQAQVQADADSQELLVR